MTINVKSFSERGKQSPSVYFPLNIQSTETVVRITVTSEKG